MAVTVICLLFCRYISALFIAEPDKAAVSMGR